MTTATREELIEFLAITQELERRANARDLSKWFPDIADHANRVFGRTEYPKHMAFFKAGAEFNERAFIAANRVGKSVCGGFETAVHATGLYPHWWEGWRMDRPIRAWCAGKTGETTRDIVQVVLFGPPDAFGSGMIPKRLIGEVKTRPNTNGALDYVTVKNEATGRWGRIGFKSFEQGRKAFEGTEQDFIWGDEEMPSDVYTECLTRTATTNGRIVLTFTPLEGVTDLVHQFMTDGVKLA